MEPVYKLTYFDSPGRAEVIRFIFAYTGRPFEDVRVDDEMWDVQLQENSPFGTLPYLEENGRILGQSLAIARYLGRKFNMAGSDDWESAQADALADAAWELFDNNLRQIKHETNPEKQSQLKREFHTKGIIPFLGGLNRQLQTNSNGERFMVGSALTWADCVVLYFLDILTVEELKAYPLLEAYRKRMHELDGIKLWLIKYPVHEREYLKIPY